MTDSLGFGGAVVAFLGCQVTEVSAPAPSWASLPICDCNFMLLGLLSMRLLDLLGLVSLFCSFEFRRII